MGGKYSNENDHDQQQKNLDPENSESSQSSSSAPLRLCGFRCFIVLVLSCVILLPTVFLLSRRRSSSEPLIDDLHNVSVKAYFRLPKPASEVLSLKGRLEHEIFQSIGLPQTKVTVLSLNQSDASNFTDVEFVLLPISTDHPISQDSLSLLKSSFLKLFYNRSNLNLTTSSFGKPSSFQVLHFPGGITVYPLGSKSVSGILMITLQFNANSSISKIQNTLPELKNQLRLVFWLQSYDNIHLRLKNYEGSTISPPVFVQALGVTNMVSHLQQRLDHLFQVIQTSHAKKSGDNSVFGEVKTLTFSTYLNGTIHDTVLLVAPMPNS